MATTTPTQGATAAWRTKIVDAAISYEDTPYGTGSGEIDCSNLVRKSYAAAGLVYGQISANSYPSSAYFKETNDPQPGDVVYWPGHPHGHVVILKNALTGEFVGAQTSTGVAVSNYRTNPYWRIKAGRKFFTVAKPPAQ